MEKRQTFFSPVRAILSLVLLVVFAPAILIYVIIKGKRIAPQYVGDDDTED